MKPKRKPSMREMLTENAKGHDFWAAMTNKSVPALFQAPDAPKPRTETVKSDADDLEAAVMKEVADVLAKHPSVLFAVRQNSGAFNVELKGGVTAPMWFYRWARSRTKMRISDYWGMTTEGRMFAIECKRRSWTKPSGEREGEQLAFILTVKNSGGIGGFVTSGEQAMQLLNTIK